MAVAAAEMAEGAGAAGAGDSVIVSGREMPLRRLSPAAQSQIRREAPHTIIRRGGAPKRGAEKPAAAPKAAPATSGSSRPSGRASSSPASPARVLSAVPGRIPSAPSGGMRLITAFFVGALVLELLSYVTGQYFNFDWALLGKKPAAGPTGGYKPLAPIEQWPSGPIPQLGGGQPVPVGPRGTGNITLQLNPLNTIYSGTLV